jgi:plasmid maintenance system antidote protein VapI
MPYCYKAAVIPKSEGQRLLQEAAREKGRRAQIARVIKRSKPTVSALVAGESAPSFDTAVALEEHLGIPIDTWHQKPRRKSGGRSKAA